jgi:hypothetical protein
MNNTPSHLRYWTITVILAFIASLSACTTLEQRKQWSEKRFGPRCESAGYKSQSPAYFECIADEDRTWRINQMEKGNRYENWMPLTYLPSITDEKKE